MRMFIVGVIVAFGFGSPAQAQPILFDFNSGPQFASLPLDLTVNGFTAHFAATGGGFSIQDTQQVILTLPTGFSGLGIVPNGVSGGDLLVSFPGRVVTAFSIMVAPQELNTDSTATMRVTAFMNSTLVGTSTSMGSPPFFWPSSTLSFSSPLGFNNVVVHYDSPPPTGGDFGTIFVADNMIVTPSPIPEPSSLALATLGVCAGTVVMRRRRR
jgi:PEP-CTERM motif-containing protein